MTFNLTTLENWISETETDVLNVVVQIKAGLAVVESEINSALHWIASNAPAIASDLSEVATLIESTPLAANPEVVAAITAANLTVQGLNAFAAASNSGSTNTQAVLAGYTAVQQAQAAVASAKAAVATPAK